MQNKEKRKNAGNSNASNVVSAAGNNSDSGDCLIVLAGCVANYDEWILDSACSFDICTNRDVVRIGDDNPREIVGIGSVQIKSHDGMTRILKNVRYILGMKRNLISLSTLDAEGIKYSGSNGVLKIS